MTRYISACFGAVVLAAFGLQPSSAPVIAAQAAFVPAPCATREWTSPEAAFDPMPGAHAFTGKYDGGLYKIEIPDKWNGELVLWSHGYVPASGANGLTLRAPDHPLRKHLIDEGFAWASSSYRCNGYIPGQGYLDTVSLVGLFTKTNGGKAPARTYFTGASMGGFATLIAMHEAPASFAGGLALCSAGPDLNEFFNDSAKSAAKVAGISPTASSLAADMKSMMAALGTPPSLTPLGRDAANKQIEFSGGPRPFAAEGILERGQMTSNISTGSRSLVTRNNPPSQYREEQPFTGRIGKPVLAMHTTGDLFVPIFLEQRLKKAVVSAGRGNLLVQRIYRAAGHCTFSEQETTTAFDDLVTWVRNGTVPAGDDVMGDLSDAGRKFTNPLRPGDPGGLLVK